MKNIKNSIKLRFTGANPILELTLVTDAKLDDADVISDPGGLVKNYIVPDSVLTKLSEFFQNKIESVFEKARNVRTDIFQVKNLPLSLTARLILIPLRNPSCGVRQENI